MSGPQMDRSLGGRGILQLLVVLDPSQTWNIEVYLVFDLLDKAHVRSSYRNELYLTAQGLLMKGEGV